MRILVAVALAMAFTYPSDAQPSSATLKTGNDFLEFCDQKNPSTAQLACIMYIRGLTDAFRLSGDICPPDGFTYTQMRDVGRKAIQDNPQSRHKWLGYLLWEGWYKAFPCPKK